MFKQMDDKTRDKIVKNSAEGFIICVYILFFALLFYGKDTGRIILLSLFPIYCLYYLVMYRLICKSYKNEDKRISSFGIIARGTFTGVIYYLSIYLEVIFISLLFVRL